MNILNTLQSWLLAACIFGVIGCFAVVLVYSFRNEIRRLWEKWRSLGRFGQCVVLLFAVAFIVYGSTKPPDGDSGSSGDDTSTTNAPPDCGRGVSPRQEEEETSLSNAARTPRLRFLPPRSTSTSTLNLSLISPWTARGAYNDWVTIPFPDDFAFPCGTNLLTSVTVMSYGELRETLRGPAFATLPPVTSNQSLTTTLSLEPDVSSVSYGLTPSNSFVIAWQNACIDRDATNRINASFELFEDGSIATMTTSDVQPSTYNLQPPVVPDGFVGEGQDTAWVTNAFPFAIDAITNLGYAAWLSDYIGVNEPNGRYKVDVTIAALPEHGPCYLVVGPYKMVVTSPGTYSFPLMDFTEYDVYTCPEAVPLSFEYDDGYQPNLDEMPLMMTGSTPPPSMMGAGNYPNHHYKICRIPEVFVNPTRIPLDEAVGKHIEIFCNAANIATRNYETLSGNISLVFGSHSDAIIEEAEVQGMVRILLECNGFSSSATVSIEWPWHYPWGDPWIYPPTTNDWSGGVTTNGDSSAGGDQP